MGEFWVEWRRVGMESEGGEALGEERLGYNKKGRDGRKECFTLYNLFEKYHPCFHVAVSPESRTPVAWYPQRLSNSVIAYPP